MPLERRELSGLSLKARVWGRQSPHYHSLVSGKCGSRPADGERQFANYWPETVEAMLIQFPFPFSDCTVFFARAEIDLLSLCFKEDWTGGRQLPSGVGGDDALGGTWLVTQEVLSVCPRAVTNSWDCVRQKREFAHYLLLKETKNESVINGQDEKQPWRGWYHGGKELCKLDKATATNKSQ